MQTTEVSVDINQLASEIQARIVALSELFAEPLEHEMDALKETLIHNPSAAALLKDEDVGLLVQNLRRTVSSAVMEANKSKEKKTPSGKKRFTAEELNAALDAEGFPS